MEPRMLRNVRSVTDLAQRLEDDGELASAFAKDPATSLRALAYHLPDTLIYRLVVISLGAVLVLSVLGAIALVMLNPQTAIPDILIATASASSGALAGMVVPQAR